MSATNTTWRYVCPSCRSTTYRPRASGDYRCQQCKTEFDSPFDKKTGSLRDGSGKSWVSPSKCESWRLEFRTHRSASRVISEADFTPQTVKRHLVGDCGHAIDEPPRFGGRSEVSKEMCAGWRHRHRAGTTQKMIAAGSDFHAATVLYHVRGHCLHSTDEPPVEGP